MEIDQTTGDYTFTLLNGQFPHTFGDDGKDTATLTFEYAIQDSDGSMNDATLTIDVIDDVPAPITDAMASITVFEDALGQGTAEAPADGSTGILDNDGNGTPDVDPDADEATFTDMMLQALVAPGADEPVTFSLDGSVDDAAVKTTSGTDVFSKGDQVTYNVVSATVIQGVADGRVVFTLTDNEDGTFTFDLDDQLDHADGGDLSTLTLDLSAAVAAELSRAWTFVWGVPQK